MSSEKSFSIPDFRKNNLPKINDEETPAVQERVKAIESEDVERSDTGVSILKKEGSFMLDIKNPEGSVTFSAVKLPTFDEDQTKRMSEYVQTLLTEIENDPERQKFIRGSELTGPSKIIADVAIQGGDTDKPYKMKVDQYLSKKMHSHKLTVESLNDAFGEKTESEDEMTTEERVIKFLDEQAVRDIPSDSTLLIQELGKKINESEKTGVAKILIEKGFQNSLLESIDKYGAVDKKEISQFLLERGEFEIIAKKFDKLGLEPSEAAQILIDNENGHLIVNNISAFLDIDKNLVETLLNSTFPSEIFFEELLSKVDKFSKISKDEIAKVLIEGGHASELLNFTYFEQFDTETIKLLVVEIESGRLDKEFLETLRYVSDESDENVAKLLASIKV